MDFGDRKSGASIGIVPIVIIGILLLIGGAFFGLITKDVLPVQASAEAGPIDNLFTVLMVIGGAVFLLVQGLLLYSVIRFRTRPEDQSDGPSFHGNTVLEIIWTSIPAVIVFFLAIYSWVVWTDIRAEKANETVIEGVGQRFNWNFTYTDPDDRLAELPQQTFSSSVLHVYVGQPILMKLQTPDVNHAFWIPTMRIKQDLLAGKVTEIRFTPTRAGRYRVVCAELCGGGHGQMFTFVEVHPDEQTYRANFIDPVVDNIINPPDDPVLNGRNTLANNTYPCSGCHIIEGLPGWSGVTGPNLSAIGSTAGRRPAPSAEYYIAQSLRHPNAYPAPGYPVGVMPQFGPTEETPAVVEGGGYDYMPDQDLVNIVAFLCTQTGGEDTACGDIEAIRQAVAEQSQ